MCYYKWITSHFVIISLLTPVSLSGFHLVECIFNRQVLVQNVHTDITAAAASPSLEVRNQQTNKRNRYLSLLTQISLWSIACFCNVAQVENEMWRKGRKQINPQYFLTSGTVFYLDSVLPFHFSPGHLTKMTRPMNLNNKTHSYFMSQRNFASWYFVVF